LKLATWNINSLNVRLPRLTAWLAATGPDVVCLQETKLVDAKFPRLELAAAGYTAHFIGQNTYNGVALIVRDGFGPVDDVEMALPDFVDEQKRVIAATVGDLRIVDFYVPNGQSVDSDKYRYKLDWCRAATAFLARERDRHPRLMVLGDFNIAPEDRDVHDPELWRGQVMCSDAERQRCSATGSRWACTTAFACSHSPRRCSAGGTTGCSRFRRIAVCGSTTSCCRRRSPSAAPRAASTATRARVKSPPITRR
jgi:exodeoxyribonuclease-3